MVHWSLVLVGFLGGGILGCMIAVLMVAIGDSNRRDGK